MAKLRPKYPVFIPSKGRSGNLMTGRALDRDGVPYFVVVEPSQAEAYRRVCGKQRVLVLPENGRGLVYSRNWITDHARKLGDERHWQIDDDIRDFYTLHAGHRIRCDAAVALRASEDFADRYENVALLSLNSFFFINFQLKMGTLPPFYRNHRCYTIILFKNSLPNRWRQRYNEDTDMTLQVLADGWCTILLNAFMIATPTTMTDKGGQTPIYVQDGRLRMARQLERVWPGVVTVKRRFQHPQHKIRGEWQLFDTPLRLKRGLSLAKIRPNDYGLALRQLREVKSPRLAKLLKDAASR